MIDPYFWVFRENLPASRIYKYLVPKVVMVEGTDIGNIDSPELLRMVITTGKWELEISLRSACRTVCPPGSGGRNDTCFCKADCAQRIWHNILAEIYT